ncbi:MAG: enoyl-CoA hydratase [Acidimicrobiaceae bacterium]|nr:enoyl-CoA hydratase [Acidimicrobiaceae bacterium]
MSINIDAVGYECEPYENSWDERDVMLYALGVGASTSELEFTTENSIGVDLSVLPTFAVIASGRPPTSLWTRIGQFDPAMLLHGEQYVEIHSNLPTAATAVSRTKVTGIYDKGSGALVVTETVTKDKGSGVDLFTLKSSAFIRGEGGFGGERGGPIKAVELPPRDPDLVITYETAFDQALIYRLSGDRNPLHSDPGFAELAGFERPILHGLCTYGFTARALLNEVCDGDVGRFGLISGRFVSPVYPGDLLSVSIWEESEGALFRTETQGGEIVLDMGVFRFRS